MAGIKGHEENGTDEDSAWLGEWNCGDPDRPNAACTRPQCGTRDSASRLQEPGSPGHDDGGRTFDGLARRQP